MKSIAQLFRQPIKTLSGILLVSLAAAVLCVCIGQSAAAANMRKSVEESYHTVALPTNKYQNGQYPQEILEWIDQAVDQHPKIILSDTHAGLASGYLPELIPDNYTDYLSPYSAGNSANVSVSTTQIGAPNTCAMLEITLREIDPVDVPGDGTAVYCTLRGTVERVIGLEEGYNDPTGYTAVISATFLDRASFEQALANDLIVGQRYLTYCMDYYDRDWALRATIAAPRDYAGPGTYDGLYYDSFTSENLFFLHPDMDSEEEWQALIDEGRGYVHVAYYRVDYIDDEGKKANTITSFTASMMMHLYHNISYTLLDYCIYSGNEAHTTPTIARLDGSAEEFLASEEGALWQAALDSFTVNNHAFPVVGVDNLKYIGNFARQNAWISEGRDFTAEELTGGADVCVISNILARKNGLTIGDTISVRYYESDLSAPFQDSLNENEGVINPTANYFTSDSVFSGEAREYTIVGFYDQTTIWDQSADDLYAFTPNTVFVPEASVSGPMEYSDMGMFRTLVLPNGGMDEFQTLLSMSSNEGLFLTYDQGYTDVINNLYGYELIARQALMVGLVIYAIVILLYFLLFPSQQGKAIGTMATMGATRLEKLRYVNISGWGILIPGTIIGVAAGIALRRQVMKALADSASVVAPLELDVGSLIITGVLQLIFAIVVTFLISIPLTRSRSLMKRRSFLERFRQLRKTPLYTWAVAILALIVSLVLCALHASNEAELENYEKTRLDVPITVSVTNLKGDQTTGLDLDGWVVNILAGDYSFALADYLKDIRIEFCIVNNPDNTSVKINGVEADRALQGLMSVSCASELLPVTDSCITWYPGYDESIFAGEEFVCIVPEGYTLDADPNTEAQELTFHFSRTEYTRDSMGFVIDSRYYEYECMFTVVGTYVSSLDADAIYCPFRAANTVATKLAMTPRLDSAGGTLKNNGDLEEFRTVASKFFVEPGVNATAEGAKKYGLKIDTSALKKAEVLLNNSITINRISTLLVFLLSAGAGFFVGFLMIRSRKREIILMRTLGKSNIGIYWGFTLEQMGYVLLGTIVGGAVYLWQPTDRLALFVAIYFIGLTAALLLFLNSKLITNMKEDE